MKFTHPYSNITIAFTTMHGKEKIVGPLFEKELSAKIVVPDNIDTDILGTFAGEVRRENDLKAVLRKKALIGIEKTGLKFGMASEGSFGPHPWIPFISCNQESLVFLDLEKGTEIFSHFISTKNTAKYIEAENIQQVNDFLKKIEFGDQGVIVKPSRDYTESRESIFKGLTKTDEVHAAFQKIKKTFGHDTVWIETDNRSFMSPMRQEVILQSAHKLLEKMKSLCPECSTPGFEMTDFIEGLICRECGIPSDKPLKEVWSCPNQLCSYQEVKDRSDGIKSLGPAECQRCNP